MLSERELSSSCTFFSSELSLTHDEMGLNLSQPAVPVCPHPSCERFFFIINRFPASSRLGSPARPPAQWDEIQRSETPGTARCASRESRWLACLLQGAGPLDSSKQQLRMMMMMPAGGRPDVTADRWPHHGHLLRLDKLLVVTCAVF